MPGTGISLYRNRARISCIIVGAPGPGAAAVWFFEFLLSRRKDIGEKILKNCRTAAQQIAVTLGCSLGIAVAVGAAGGLIYGIVFLSRNRKLPIITLSSITKKKEQRI